MALALPNFFCASSLSCGVYVVPPFVFNVRDDDDDNDVSLRLAVGAENMDDILECLDSIGSIVSKPMATKSGSFFGDVVYIPLL